MAEHVRVHTQSKAVAQVGRALATWQRCGCCELCESGCHGACSMAESGVWLVTLARAHSLHTWRHRA